MFLMLLTIGIYWFLGLVPRIMKVAPSCAIMISSYEFGKAYFRKRKEKNDTSQVIL